MDKQLNYTLVGGSIEQPPHYVTGEATVRWLVKTKAGSYHTLLVQVNVSVAQHLRSVFGGVCAQFKTLARQLWEAL